ncbi:MAG: hypothetical protein BWY31_00834 [Lentisphaerae bacterium ADurb.Bin242]|nr:MAG: hypothetical protein BWY31_00834 [Lentisphaerae bacterium ADurb.Bin242]
MKKFLYGSLLFSTLLCNASENLVVNGDFEKIDKDGYLASYSRIPEWGGDGVKKASFLPDGNAYAGNYAARYDCHGAGGFISHGGITLTPGKTYRFSAMIKTDLSPVMEASMKANPPPGAFIQLMPVLPKDWRGAWPKLDLPRLIAGGGKQDWKKYTGYFIANKKFNQVWFGIYVMKVEGTAWFDDIELVESTPEEAAEFNKQLPKETVADSENLMFNSSFELTMNGDFPDFLFSPIGAAWFEQEWKTRLVEAEDAPDGKYYFHLAGRYTMITSPIVTDPERICSVSFFAKSVLPGQRGQVAFGNSSHSFDLTPEWKKHHFVLDKKRNAKSNRLYIGTVNGKGELDLDAVMLHYEAKELPYAPSRDEVRFKKILAARKNAFFAENAKSLKIGDSPTFLLDGTPSTKVAMSLKDNEIMIKTECEEPEIDKLLTYPAETPWMLPFGDSLSVSFMPHPGRENMAYKTFTINADGAKLAEYSLGQKIDVSWKADVKKEAGKWIAVIRIPIPVLMDNVGSAKVWGFNIVRRRPEHKGRTRLLSGWNGVSPTAFGRLDMGHHKIPVSIGEMKYQYGKNRKLTLAFPADAPTNAKWTLQIDSSANFSGNYSNGEVLFENIGKLVLFGAKEGRLECREAGVLLYSESITLPEKWPIFSIDYKYDVAFVSEGNIFRPVIALDKQDRANSTITLEFKNSSGKEWKETFLNTQGDFAAGKALPEGEYSVSATLNWDGRDNQINLPWRFSVFSKASRYCRVDRFAHMVEKDGNPFFPCALGFSLAWKFRDRIPEIKESGFNMVFLWSMDINDRVNRVKMAEVYDILEKNELGAIQYTPLEKDDSFTKKYGAFLATAYLPFDKIMNTKEEMVKELKDRKGLCMWSHYDEIYSHWEKPPMCKTEMQLTASQKILRKLDPMRLHWNNSVISNRLFGGVESTDIVSATVYTIRNDGGAAETISAGEGLANVGKKLGGKPSIAGIWLQYYTGDGEVGTGGREPSFQEMTAMMYGCAVKGVRAFWYFNQRSLSNRLYRKTGQNIRELEQLTPIFAKGKPCRIACSHSGVLAIGYEYEGKLYLITVNSAYSDIEANFRLPAGYAAGTAKHLFEAGTEKIADHTLNLSYKALERKVLIIKNKEKGETK